MEDSYVLQLLKPKFKDFHLCFCGFAECKPLHSYGPAARPNYILHYVMKGKGIYQVGETKYQLKEGQAFLNSRQLTCECEYGEELKEIVFEMLHHTSSTAENLYYLQGKLYQFFSVLARGIEIQQYSNDTKESIHVQEAIAYIKNYYSQKITVEDIANYLALNRSYLYTIFMNSLGISPKDFLTEFRISRGKEQLALTNLSVEEIAVSCGYRNSLAFGKIFKQKVGITPTQYRNDNRKDARERLIRAQNELEEYKKHKTIYVGNIEKE